MPYLSDMNLRAVLTVLVVRAGGQVDITNQELYGAMLPSSGRLERFRVDDTETGIRISIDDLEEAEPVPTEGAGG
jgi:hypothetical protein